MSRLRTRKRLLTAAAVLMVVGLVSAGCGSRVGAAGAGGSSSGTCADTSGSSVKIGFLNSLSGTMAISEKTVHDSLVLAAEQINSSGGVLGKQLSVVSEDGASEPTIFAEKAGKLISSDCVAAVFGGWTSASRKAMLPVFEGANSLLFYPVQYEGLEALAEHLLHWGNHQPADCARAGLLEAERRQVHVPGGLRLRLSAYREQGDQGIR